MLKKKTLNPAETAWRILRIQLMQPESFECYTFAGKLSTVLFSLVQCSILLGLYSSWILANIIKHESNVNTYSVNTLIQQIKNNEIKLVCNEPNEWIIHQINHSDSYPYAEFREVFKLNPIVFTKNINETLEIVGGGTAFTFLQDDDRINFYSRHRCDLEAIREGMPMVKVYLMFRRGSTLIASLNGAIERNRRSLVRLSKKYAELLKKQRLSPYVGLAAVCATIIAGAVGVLIAEIFIDRYGYEHAF
ncbi:hypothetical protein M3Y96_01015600 [Aphelenchoides besseyi]|nr:hypothetical protein M3Y96_01015600 [Aphelenchoides besseyi]